MSSWYVAPSLKKLRDEINDRWPGRDKKSDGSVGDTSHKARKSDHNPNSRGSVNALDIDKDGIDVYGLRDILIKDKRVNYVIFNGLIYSRVRGFKPKKYTGPNAHTAHLHVSINQSRNSEQDTSNWGISKAGDVSKPRPRPKPKPGVGAPKFPYGDGHYIGLESSSRYSHSGANSSDRTHVKRWQQRMRDRGWSIAVDGYFGEGSFKVAKEFQKQVKVKQDGKVGAQTWRLSWEAPVT